MRVKSHLHERRAAIVVSLILLAGCGASATPITFDETTASGPDSTAFGLGSLPPDSTTAAPTDSTTAPAASGQWVDITGNLVGADSECGTTTLLTSRTDRDGMIAGVAKQGVFGDESSSEQWASLGQGP